MSDAAALGVMGAALFFSLAYLADVYTTFCGLSGGLAEGNPIMRWAFKKVDKALASFIGGAIVLVLGGFMTNFGAAPAAAFFGIVGVGEAVQAFKNYRLLKKAGISLK